MIMDEIQVLTMKVYTRIYDAEAIVFEKEYKTVAQAIAFVEGVKAILDVTNNDMYQASASTFPAEMGDESDIGSDDELQSDISERELALEDKVKEMRTEIRDLLKTNQEYGRCIDIEQAKVAKLEAKLAIAMDLINKYAGPNGSGCEVGSIQHLCQVTRKRIQEIE